MKTNIAKTQKTAESAIMIALSLALCWVSEILPWPFLQGGSVTPFAMVPLIIIGYRHGTKQGLLTAFIFSLFEMMFGFKNFSFVTGIFAYIVLALTDYIIAYSVMGLGGMFKGKFGSRQSVELAAAGVICCLLRFICHFISGIVIWGGYCPEGQAVWIYSLTYNGSYMLPETVITAVGLAAVGSILNFTGKDISKNKNKM